MGLQIFIRTVEIGPWIFSRKKFTKYTKLSKPAFCAPDCISSATTFQVANSSINHLTASETH